MFLGFELQLMTPYSCGQVLPDTRIDSALLAAPPRVDGDSKTCLNKLPDVHSLLIEGTGRRILDEKTEERNGK
jgi:hypothetical protein